MNIAELKFDENGLIPAVVQDAVSKEVLTVAYMNEESLKKNSGNEGNMVLQPFAPKTLA